MKFSIGVIIFFLALLALVAEIVLYFIFGIGAAFSGGASSVTGVAAFFVWLMILTIVAGIAAPVCGFIESISKKPNLGMYIFLPLLGLTALGVGGLMIFGYAVTLKGGNQALFSSGGKPSAGSNAWRVLEDKSEMDGSKSVTLQLDAENEIQGWLKRHRPKLVINCHEGKTSVYAVVGQANVEYGLHNRHTVRIRLDEHKAVTQMWSESTDNEALFAPNGAALADQMAQAKTMLLEFTPFNASPATVRFNVTGLDQHIGKVKEACRRGK